MKFIIISILLLLSSVPYPQAVDIPQEFCVPPRISWLESSNEEERELEDQDSADLSIFSTESTQPFSFSTTPQEEEESKHRYGSFAPVHEEAVVKWFVDGKDHMSAIADAIESASKEILIIDHILNPHIFMKRSDNGVDNNYWRLDQMLLRKAEAGVKIYILLFQDADYPLIRFNLGVKETIATLKHENIHIYSNRHVSTDIGQLGFWTNHEKVLVADRSIAFVSGIDLCFGRWDTHSHPLTDNYPLHPSIDTEESTTSGDNGQQYRRWIGKDYRNSFIKDITDYSDPLKDHLDREKDHRLPYHDVSVTFTGPAVQDAVTHFIQRYNLLQEGLLKFFFNPIKLSPGDIGGPYHTISDPTATGVKVQLVRSVAEWVTGQPLEHSIHDAYCLLISSAKHFIYIENQFFISSQPPDIENTIMEKLAERIIRAHDNNESFHVIVVMPLKPDFSGNWEDNDHLRGVSYRIYSTVQTGENSLYNRLMDSGIPEEKIPQYFSIYGLRKYDRLGDQVVTEIIYVHSKIMIVDDRVSVIGSANINDRSMLGDRDSEMCLIIEDTQMEPGTMNGEEFEVGKFSHSLRCHLFREHLTLLDDEKYSASDIKVEDPVLPSFFTKLQKIASANTKIYEEVFGGKVEQKNDIHTLDDLKKWRKVPGLIEADRAAAEKKLKDIVGSFVTYPALFLKSNLKISLFDKFFHLTVGITNPDSEYNTFA
ncbi:PREDICTED: phospholipase D1-like [Amphimedon queenslandica]|uniref:phospholipase D n=1 Tax=Amphimedon queenslandica TaxID=400682 RepID=A0A1X7UIT5_AMPQE|nr:PREDICTED: phospholipase D1-like [Amphimedon queenslandica]|eukprot:XP_003387699.1 PREDICTED: phospholipase D1-like [Amphimedon queenslandica]